LGVIYNLNKLIAWARRAAGDRAQRTREIFAGDGETVEFTLGNEGGILIGSISADGQVVRTGSDYAICDNVLTFQVAPDDASRIVVIYSFTRYTDEEILEFLVDAATIVGGDIHVAWTITRSGVLNNVPDDLAVGTDLDHAVQKLIVYAAADVILTDKSNTAADEAIMVRDGSTTIDTSRASGASGKSLDRSSQRYKEALVLYRSRKFRGQSMNNQQRVISY